MSEDSKLSELRNKIDAIDQQLLKLLEKRAEIVVEVGKHKGDNNGNNFIRSGREARMIRELTEQGAGGFPRAAIKSIWRVIISASLGLESGLKVALLNDLDLESYQVIVEYFGSFIGYKECDDEDDILAAIDQHTIGIFTLDSGWWLKLAEPSHKHLKIFARLSDKLFAVAKLETESSGVDRTIAITHVNLHKGHQMAEHGKVKLVELPGFLDKVPDAIIIGHYGL